MARVFKHLAFTRWQLRRAFPRATLDAIEHAIQQSEARRRGEIRFVVEGALHGRALLAGQTARERAVELFSLLRVWDTEGNNGVLIYVLLADRCLEIVADRGIHARATPGLWSSIAQAMEHALGRGQYEVAALDAVRAVAGCLEADGATRPDELPNRPLILE
jgi:uncharacterized membrane protein